MAIADVCWVFFLTFVVNLGMLCGWVGGITILFYNMSEHKAVIFSITSEILAVFAVVQHAIYMTVMYHSQEFRYRNPGLRPVQPLSAVSVQAVVGFFAMVAGGITCAANFALELHEMHGLPPPEPIPGRRWLNALGAFFMMSWGTLLLAFYILRRKTHRHDHHLPNGRCPICVNCPCQDSIMPHSIMQHTPRRESNYSEHLLSSSTSSSSVTYKSKTSSSSSSEADTEEVDFTWSSSHFRSPVKGATFHSSATCLNFTYDAAFHSSPSHHHSPVPYADFHSSPSHRNSPVPYAAFHSSHSHRSSPVPCAAFHSSTSYCNSPVPHAAHHSLRNSHKDA